VHAYVHATTTAATTATVGAATAAGGLAATGALLALAVGSLLLTSSLGLAGKLDGDLALKDFLAGQLRNGTVSLGRGRKVDEGVANRAFGARVLGNRDRLAA
jgi:hypothetical protein